jgi:acyl-CoA-dependent ceramide synthase
MSNSTAYEPFPNIVPNVNINHVKTEKNTNVKTRRRRSSGLPADPVGDTSAPALATLDRDRELFSSSSPAVSTSLHDDSTSTTSDHLLQRTPNTTRGHKRRKAKTLFKRWARFSLRHTWVNPLILCLIGVALYLINPTSANPMRSALFLSYPVAGTSPVEYGKGGRDFAFVAYYTIFFSFTRELVMQRYLRPLAISYGLKSRAKQSRFMEQAYTAIYFFFMAPLGLYVMYRSPVWYFRTEGMYENFPHRQHEGLFKAYYLLQAAYWLQQTVVMLLGLEAPRKDYNELVLHHVITIALIWCSYRFHFAFMGIGVFFTHDASDFFLAVSFTRRTHYAT